MANISGFEVVENNKAEILRELIDAKVRALTEMGMKAEKYAKYLCKTGTVRSTGKKGYRGGTLKNSITFEIDKENGVVHIGSNVEYAPYVELGTGPNFTPPPEWETFDTPTPSGLGHSYVKARPFLRPAITDHLDEYKRIIEDELH